MGLGFLPKRYKATANQGNQKQTQDNLPVLGVPGNLSIPLLGKEILQGNRDKDVGPVNTTKRGLARELSSQPSHLPQ